MHFLYNASLYFYLFTLRIAALFNTKARLWIKGRQEQQKAYSLAHFKNTNIIWLHCASLGEFEQGRPLLEKIKIKYPGYKILLTFFSPSGYESKKKYPGADYVLYLPLETIVNVKKFIAWANPKIVFFVKYEFWFNYLNELKKNNIPTYLISGIFRQTHYFFKPYGFWFRKQLNCFTHFYLQDSASAKLLLAIGHKNVTISGDTRFDRVTDITKNTAAIEVVKQFTNGKKIIIAGSTWREDEQIISTYDFKKAGFKLIIAPHEIGENQLKYIGNKFASYACIRYSEANEQNIKDVDVLIIDNIGMLSVIYQYGTIAYIGGGFGKGIHNILEAATFGLPVIFGSNYQNFIEAKELIQLGGAFSVNNQIQFQETIKLLNDQNKLAMAGHIAKKYVSDKTGATDIILSSIKLK